MVSNSMDVSSSLTAPAMKIRVCRLAEGRLPHTQEIGSSNLPIPTMIGSREVSILSKRFMDVFDKTSPVDKSVDDIELDSDDELEDKFSQCLERGHNVYKHADQRSMSYGHVCKHCGKYFHRHMCLGGRGSSIGVK